MFAEKNSPADGQIFHVKAIDKFPINLVFSESDFEFMKNKNSKIVSVTCILPYSLELKIEAKAMLTCNIDTEDRLINGQIGTVCHFMSNHQQVWRIYVKFDDLRECIKVPSHE